MFLRNKIAILSVTLMSMMTIPTLAENDNAPVTSRIENDYFDVEIKTPEGWSQTKDFTSIPETCSLDGRVYKGLQFKTALENHGCVVFFAEGLSDDKYDDDSLFDLFKQTHTFAFPGSKPANFSISKLNLDGSLVADFEKEEAKADAKGTIYGTVSYENEETTPLTLTGKVQADSTKGNCIVGSGTFLKEGSMPIIGTTAILSADGYEVLIMLWGNTEEEQIKAAHCFMEALCVKKKAPAAFETEPVVSTESGAEKNSDTLLLCVLLSTSAANETPAEKVGDANAVTKPVAEKTETPSTETRT